MKMLTRRQAAQMLGVSVPTLDRMRYAGELPGTRVGRRGIRISEESVQEYADTHQDTRSAGHSQSVGDLMK